MNPAHVAEGVSALVSSAAPAAGAVAPGTAPAGAPAVPIGQVRADVAVVLVTVLRDTLVRAVESVFAQDFPGRIHLLIGIDVALGDRAMLDALRARCPEKVEMTVLDLGYSTSQRHGGPHINHFGGSLQTVLTFLAKAPAVAYLDDDDWYAPNHLSSLHAALQGHLWAFTLAWYTNPWNLEDICVDRLESVGPNAGGYANTQGGFVRPSCLMVDKMAVQPLMHLWSYAFAPNESGDRLVFQALRQHAPNWGVTDQPTVHYLIKPTDETHAIRLEYFREQGYDLTRLRHGEPFIAPRV